MTVQVRLSAGLARRAGRSRLSVAVGEGATVAELVERLAHEHPELGEGLAAAIAVVGGRHASPGEALRSGEEVALLLPVAGGACERRRRDE